MARELRVNIVGDDSSFSRAMRRVEQDLGHMDQKVAASTRIWQDNAGRWRNSIGQFASAAELAAEGIEAIGEKSGRAGDQFGGLSLRVLGVSGRLKQLAPVVAAATPFMVALGGAATAVAGSLGAAAAGAGALGTGFAASMAPVLVVGKQVTSRFEEIKKAYEAVKTAQREGTEAARKNAQQALADLSVTERAMVDSFGRLASLQEKVLGGASDRIIGALSAAINRVAPALETLQRPFDRLGDAIAGVIRRASRALSGPEWTGALRAFVNSATALVKPISEAFGAIANIMRDVALAALPLVRSALRNVARELGALDATATRGKIREVVRDLIDHTRSWWRLTKAVGELLFRVLNGGADAGQSLVDSLTKVVNRWNRFLATEDGQRQMRRFFRDAVKLAQDLAVILGAVAAAIFKVSDLIIRATNGLQDLERWVGNVDAAVNRWVSGALRDLRRALAAIPGLVLTIIRQLPAKVVGASVTVGKAIGEGILAGAKSALTGSGGGLGNAILDNLPGLGAARRLGKLVGDGVGKKVLPPLPAGGSTGLMGADPDLAPFAAIGARFGLRVSDGLRAPGTRTSSGGISLHSTGDAIDMSGPTSGMMQFARTMASRFGSRLSELIYSPMGFSIKDGKRTAPYAVADHYDHVHLAYEGPFGDGPGRRIFNYFKGRGFTDEQAAAWVGNFVQESRLNPAIVQPGGEGHGLAQWGGSRFTALQAFAKRKGTPWQNMQTQLDFVMFELAGTERAAYSQIKRAGSLEEAVNAIGSAYERFGISGDRLGPARAALERYSGGGASGAGGGGGGAAGSGARGAHQRAQREARGQVRQAEGTAREAFREERAAARELPAARLGVRRAKAEARDDLSGLIKVMQDERKAKRRRLRAIRKVLKRRINKKRRLRLLNEEAELIAEIGDLNESIKEYKADQAGGATTISRADELDAGVDTSADAGGGGADTTAAAAEAEHRAAVEALIATQTALIAQQVENQRLILRLVPQGNVILAAIVAAVNGDLGGRVGLGFQSTGYAPGSVAAY